MNGTGFRACVEAKEPVPARSRGRMTMARVAVLAGVVLVMSTVLVVVPVLGMSPANVASAASDPVLVVAGDISCGPTDTDFNGSDPTLCQQRATANLIHSIGPDYLLPGGDTQYNPTFTEGVGPAMSDFTAGYDASWGQLQNPSSSNYVPGLIVRPTPGDHEYGDAHEDDHGTVGDASSYYQNFGPSGLDDLPPGDTGPSSDFYSFGIPVNGATWHVISLDGECAALPATPGGGPSDSAAGCASGSPQETFLHNDLATHRGLIHWHQPAWSEGDNGPTDTDYGAIWDDALQFHVTAIVNGHDHDYERWKPLDDAGNPDPNGVTEIVAGTGGDSHSGDDFPNSNVVQDDFTHFGVLQLTLHTGSAAFAFKATSSLPGLKVHINNIVGAVPTSTGQGYWMIGSDGGVFAFGDAGFVGSLPGLGLRVSNIVAFARE